jgi:hypothetical protein
VPFRKQIIDRLSQEFLERRIVIKRNLMKLLRHGGIEIAGNDLPAFTAGWP